MFTRFSSSSIVNNVTESMFNTTNNVTKTESMFNTTNNVTKTESMFNTTNNVTKTECLTLQFEEYIPWNNPDNIVTAEQEDFVRQLKDLVFLPITFLIGCPANIINMMVFYKQGLKERINVCLFALSLSDEVYMAYNMLWYGPVMRFIVNHNLSGFNGLIWCSQIFNAIIATDRCYCILQPLRYQTLIRTSTIRAIIAGIFLVVGGILFIVATRYRIACALDPITGTTISIITPAEFYWHHQQLIDYLDGFIYGAALPTLVTVVVTATTIITTIKLRQAVQWRTGTSSSSSAIQKEIGLTRMLVANSIFFIICVIPFIIGRIIVLFVPELNAGRRFHNFHMMAVWVLSVINYFNASFNIFVYYSMGSRYRETFWQIFSCSTNKNSNNL